MNGYSEKTETVNFKEEIGIRYRAEAAVIGGGPSGLCAAIAAARCGADTILIEQGNCAGGMATQGLVGPFMTCYDKSGKTQIIRGLFEEIVERMVGMGGALRPKDVYGGTAFTSWIKAGHDHVTPFEPEALKIVADGMLKESGVKVLYHTGFVSPIVENRELKAVVVNSKSGLQGVSAKVFIDCTGDADVAFACKAPFEFGNPALKIVQPVSMIFRIGNVNSARVEQEIEEHKTEFYRKNGVNYRSLHWRVSEAKANGDWDLERVSVGIYRGVKEDEWTVNTSRIMNIDPTDNESLTYAETEGREQVWKIYRFLKKYVPGCENARLLCSASTIGVRESRHILGEYRLKTEDIINGNVPADSILLAANSIDIHGRFGALSNEYKTIENGEYYGIPYRALIPKGVEGLLVAGRSISAESDAAGAVRLMPICMGTGQAAGTAAALAVKEQKSVRNISSEKLRESLLNQGVFLG